jgi:hypothetical protein
VSNAEGYLPSDVELRVTKFASLLTKLLKVKLSKFHSSLVEDLSQQGSIVDYLTNVFNISRSTREEVAQEIAFAQSQKGSFLEMAANLSLIDNNPYYNVSAFPTREMLDRWKASETKAVHTLMEKIDPSAYQVFTTGDTGHGKLKARIRIKLIKARNLTPKGANSPPYCTVDFGSETFETEPANQSTTDPIWDEQITL